MIRILAHIISIIFHPILMAIYMLILLMWINPYLFGASGISQRTELLVLMLPTSVVIPVVCILLMKPLGFINSYQLHTRQERIVPYITTGVLYTWLFINIYHQTLFPRAYVIFFLGALIALFIAFFINNFSKISAHSVGAGGLLGMMILTYAYFSYDAVEVSLQGWWQGQISMSVILVATIIVVGLIGTSRLILEAHTRQDIYGGYIVGLSSQLIAFQIMNAYGN
ncbi:MAG: hypothetical protein R3275_06440 [Saprospiraceae bacterium]|nr:hypothetical protein [Saprospiraceae bacterium]